MRQDELSYEDREIMIASDIDLDDVPERSQKAILDALKDGKTIEAIKLYREVTGFGLRESKLAVESVRNAMAKQNKTGKSEDASVYGDDISRPETIKLVRNNNLMHHLKWIVLVVGTILLCVKIVKYLFFNG